MGTSFFYFLFKINFTPFVVSNCLVATILSHRYNSCMDSGETKVESHASSDTQLLNTARIRKPAAPMCRRLHRAPGNLS